ncbi:MAG TPA: NADH-quinone oxidoreductase subunit C [Myxococcota bacterium]|nr:NADH-quinone oxidoreductase subunit C [Myxococcota bacterium]
MSKAALDALVARFPDAVVAHGSWRGDEWAVVRGERLVELARWLRDEASPRFEMLVDLTAVDYLGYEGSDATPPSAQAPQPGEERFEVVYHLLALGKMKRLRLKVRLWEDAPEVDSLVPVWPGANWFEREAWDLYGIRFKGHPDLRRLLLYEEFVGHPLRKDYPKDKQQPLVGPTFTPARPFTGGRDLLTGPPEKAGLPAQTPPGAALERLGERTEPEAPSSPDKPASGA